MRRIWNLCNIWQLEVDHVSACHIDVPRGSHNLVLHLSVLVCPRQGHKERQQQKLLFSTTCCQCRQHHRSSECFHRLPKVFEGYTDTLHLLHGNFGRFSTTTRVPRLLLGVSKGEPSCISFSITRRQAQNRWHRVQREKKASANPQCTLEVRKMALLCRFCVWISTAPTCHL